LKCFFKNLSNVFKKIFLTKRRPGKLNYSGNPLFSWLQIKNAFFGIVFEKTSHLETLILKEAKPEFYFLILIKNLYNEEFSVFD